MSEPVSIAACALKLGMSRRQLERHLLAGAPQARPGRRGRGGQALLDPEAIGAWLAVRSGSATTEARLRALAADLPEIVARTLHERFLAIEGSHKKAVGREFQQLWGHLTEALVERIGRDLPDVCGPVTVPDAIVQIAQSCRI